MPELIKYVLVYALSGFKFIFGPTMGVVYEFSIVVTGILTTLGMMTTVYIISYFGQQIRSLVLRFTQGTEKKKNFSPKRRQLVRIWRQYGVQGIAFLTPILLTPAGGALLANALGAKRTDIIKWMWIFGTFWAFVLTAIVKYAGALLKEFHLL